MAKVESPSHTHLVLNESIGSALQFRGDHDPSRERLHRGEEQSEGTDCETGEIFLENVSN